MSPFPLVTVGAASDMGVIASLKSLPWVAALVGFITAAVSVVVSVFLGRSNSRLRGEVGRLDGELDAVRKVVEVERENVRLASGVDASFRGVRDSVCSALSDGDSAALGEVMDGLRSRSDSRLR